MQTVYVAVTESAFFVRGFVLRIFCLFEKQETQITSNQTAGSSVYTVNHLVSEETGMKKAICWMIAVLFLLTLGCSNKEAEAMQQGDMFDALAENKSVVEQGKDASTDTTKTVLAKTVSGEESCYSFLWYYHLQQDGTAMLDDCVCVSYQTALTLPEKVDGSLVTALGRNTFRDEDLSLVASLTIPNTITKIDGNPFQDEIAVYKLIVSDTHPTLEIVDGALYDKHEKRLIIAFAGAEGDRIPDNTEVIEDHAFVRSMACPSVITIPASVKEIGNNPFAKKTMRQISVEEGNPRFEIQNGCLFDTEEKRLIVATLDPYKDLLGSRDKDHQTIECKTPDDTTIIDDYAFWTLDSVSSARTVFQYAISNGITKIGINPFGANSYFVISSENTEFETTGNVLYSKTYKRVICGLGNRNLSTIPEGAEIIGDYSYIWTEGEFVIPNSVKEVGRDAFHGNGKTCLPESILRIAAYAFGGSCEILDEKLILSGDVTVGSRAFSCSLKEIEIKDGDSILHSGMLELYSAADQLLERVSFGKGEIIIGTFAFGKCKAEFIVYPDTFAEKFVKDNDLQYRYAK